MILLDNAGQPVPVGRVRKSLVEPFYAAAALPSWLTSDLGTVSFQTAASSPGLMRGTTGAVSGNQANLKTAFTVSSPQFTEIAMTIEGFRCDLDSLITLRMILGGTNCGCELRQSNTDTTAILRIRNAGGDQDVVLDYSLRGGGFAGQRRNLTLLVRGRMKRVWVLEDDQVMASVDTAAKWTDGTITPEVQLTTNSAAARWFQVEQFKFSTQSD